MISTETHKQTERNIKSNQNRITLGSYLKASTHNNATERIVFTVKKLNNLQFVLITKS